MGLSAPRETFNRDTTLRRPTALTFWWCPRTAPCLCRCAGASFRRGGKRPRRRSVRPSTHRRASL